MSLEDVKNTMNAKHLRQMATHEHSYGAPLGHLKVEPTQEQLDKEYEERRAKGDLFTQTKKD